MQGEVAVAELDRVPGVVAAVVAGDDVEAVGEKVNDLALPLVAPLSAQDRHDLHGTPHCERDKRFKIAGRLAFYTIARRMKSVK